MGGHGQTGERVGKWIDGLTDRQSDRLIDG